MDAGSGQDILRGSLVVCTRPSFERSADVLRLRALSVLQDPSDPTTYPDLNALLPDTTQSAATNPVPPAQVSTNLRTNASTYSGLPEV